MKHKRNPLTTGGLQRPIQDTEWRKEAYRREDGVIQCPKAYTEGYGWGGAFVGLLSTGKSNKKAGSL